jgi:hypothetical protein
VIHTGNVFTVEDFVPHPVFGNRHFIMTSFKAGKGLGVIAHDITKLKEKKVELIKQNKTISYLK